MASTEFVFVLYRSNSLLIATFQVGANKDKSVTKVASIGMWVPVHRDEWDNETPLEIGAPTIDSQSGEVAFSGDALPWKTGLYEVRQLYVKLFARSNLC